MTWSGHDAPPSDDALPIGTVASALIDVLAACASPEAIAPVAPRAATARVRPLRVEALRERVAVVKESVLALVDIDAFSCRSELEPCRALAALEAPNLHRHRHRHVCVCVVLCVSVCVRC